MLTAREILTSDIPFITEYWLSASDDYLRGMGADPSLIPSKDYWVNALQTQIETSYKEKNSFGTVWLVDDKRVGHCNLNKINFGEDAFMHLHLWDAPNRKRGLGVQLVKKSLTIFFEKFELKKIFCEPYSLNPAPNNTLPKCGFEFLKEYTTIPGSINFEQDVKRWVLSAEKFHSNLN